MKNKRARVMMAGAILFGLAAVVLASRWLLRQLHGSTGQPLLASLPRELVMRIVDAASFAGVAPRLSAASLEQAWHSLFACCSPKSPAPAVADHVLLGDKV